MEIRMVSNSEFKLKEAEKLLLEKGIKVIPVKKKIEELQTEDIENLVKDKALKAFKITGRPLFVEHIGLYIDYLNGSPGGLTQIFWEKLGADKFSELYGNTPDTKATARSLIGYCDGFNIKFFKGEVKGRISLEPRGNRECQWDCVFIPDGYAKTFAELGEIRNEIFMRRQALDRLAEYLKKEEKK